MNEEEVDDKKTRHQSIRFESLAGKSGGLFVSAGIFKTAKMNWIAQHTHKHISYTISFWISFIDYAFFFITIFAVRFKNKCVSSIAGYASTVQLVFECRCHLALYTTRHQHQCPTAHNLFAKYVLLYQLSGSFLSGFFLGISSFLVDARGIIFAFRRHSIVRKCAHEIMNKVDSISNGTSAFNLIEFVECANNCNVCDEPSLFQHLRCSKLHKANTIRVCFFCETLNRALAFVHYSGGWSFLHQLTVQNNCVIILRLWACSACAFHVLLFSNHTVTQ